MRAWCNQPRSGANAEFVKEGGGSLEPNDFSQVSMFWLRRCFGSSYLSGLFVGATVGQISEAVGPALAFSAIVFGCFV